MDEFDGFIIGFRGWKVGSGYRLIPCAQDDNYWYPENQGGRATCHGDEFCSDVLSPAQVNQIKTGRLDGLQEGGITDFTITVQRPRLATENEWTYFRTTVDGKGYAIALSGIALRFLNIDSDIFLWLDTVKSFRADDQQIPKLIRQTLVEELIAAVRNATTPTPLTAIPEDAIVPNLGCRCGLHAWYDLADVHTAGYGVIWGAVKAWGKIVEHGDEGFRAQHAKVIALCSSKARPDLVRAIAAMYGVPVVKDDRIMLWAREFGDIKPGGNLQSRMNEGRFLSMPNNPWM